MNTQYPTHIDFLTSMAERNYHTAKNLIPALGTDDLLVVGGRTATIGELFAGLGLTNEAQLLADVLIYIARELNTREDLSEHGVTDEHLTDLRDLASTPLFN